MKLDSVYAILQLLQWFVYCERVILFVFDVKGADENFGLGMLAMEEVLRNVEGGRHTVAVSI